MNAHVSNTTGIAPYNVWFGYTPRGHQPDRSTTMPLLEKRKKQLKEARLQAQEAMIRAQQGWVKEAHYKPYAKGERVWLEGKNLRMSHPTTKLRPKRFGPFTVTEVLGPTMYTVGWISQQRGKSTMPFMARYLCPTLKQQNTESISQNRHRTSLVANSSTKWSAS